MIDDKSAQDAQEVARMEADVGLEHIGSVYAEALLKAAEGAGAKEDTLEAFDALVSDAFGRFPDFERILESALIQHEEKIAVLDRVLGSRAPEVFLNFLKVVSRHDRMDCLRAIHAQTRVLYDKARGVVPVELVTPVAIDDASAARLTERIGQLIGGQPVLSRRVDPALIGGAVVRVGDMVYDGSVAASLQSICQQMIDRSVHEIQSRRDRFRYPTGD